MKVSQILAEIGGELKTAPVNCLVPEASRLIAAANVGALIIVDANNGPIGILSERDIARACGDRISDLATTPVSDLMSPIVHTCTLDDTLEEVREQTTAYRVRHLPVVEKGVLIGMLSMRDIAEFEARLLSDDHRVIQDTEAKFRQVVEVSPNGIYVQINGCIVYANCAFTSLLGLADSSAILGRDSIELFDPGYRAPILERRKLVQDTGGTAPFSDVRFMRSDGSVFQTETTARLVVWDGKSAIMVIVRDVTSQKMAGQKLQAGEERYRLIVDQSPEAAYVSVDHKLVFANRAYLAQVGARSIDDVVGRSNLDFIHPDDRYIVTTQRARLAASGVALDPVEVRRIRLDGSEYLAESVLAPLIWDGTPAVQVVCRDITLHKQAEMALIHAKEKAELGNRAKSEFLASMSHELRTPLNAIIGFAQILGQEDFDPARKDEYREYASHIQTAGEHLLSLINDVLDTSKIESGNVELCEEPVDLAEIIQASVVLIGKRTETGGVSIRTEVASASLPLLSADPRRLKQILINLLSNAVKFTPAGGTVVVKAWHNPDSGYVLQVIDTGIGIAMNDIPKALARFQQIDSALNRQFDGTGLGLPLTKALVELHGGSLDLQSQVGVGTTVTIRLPTERAIELAA